MEDLCVGTERCGVTKSNTSAESEPESAVDAAQGVTKGGREYVSKAAPYLRRGVESGAVPAVVGGAGFLSGFRALLRGDYVRSIVRFTLGGALLGIALEQRRSRDGGGGADVEETEVVDTGLDVESVADETGGVGEEDHATGEAAADVVDTGVDSEDLAAATESEAEADDEAEGGSEKAVGTSEEAEAGDDTTFTAGTSGMTAAAGGTGAGEGAAIEKGIDVGEAPAAEEVDRLGQAALDGQSREVPAPQRAFNQGFLAHSAEAFWGIRRRDDAVLVSQNYDAIADRDGVEFVTSSEIGDDVRELPIPDAVRDHWDTVFGGGSAVNGGDDVLFVTTDDLSADSLLWVLPAAWADDLSE